MEAREPVGIVDTIKRKWSPSALTPRGCKEPQEERASKTRWPCHKNAVTTGVGAPT